MPLFGSKFSPKKGTPRKATSLSNLNLEEDSKAEEFALDYNGPIKMKLGNQEISFDKESGSWITEGSTGAAVHKGMTQLEKNNRQMKEENHLLKLKIELLLDMLAQSTAEVHLQENEIEQLKKLMKKK